MKNYTTSLSYHVLEKKYYKVLSSIFSSINNGNELPSRAKLPYFLEDMTLSRLKPSPNWIISGISGTGKTTISKQLISSGFHKLRNVTTRPRRSEEKINENIFVNDSKFFLWKHKNLLFYPHKRNGVWHAILKKDIRKLINENSFIYLDKSVNSSIVLKTKLSKKVSFTFIYLLSPTFKELYKRILKRESLREKSEESLSKKEIFNRFKEEIDDMKKSTKIPYVYTVNDSLKRLKKILDKTIKDSKRI